MKAAAAIALVLGASFLAACISSRPPPPPPPQPSEISVEGSGVSISDGSASISLSDLTDFGRVSRASTPVQHTFSVTNLGPGALITSGLTVPNGFTVVEGLGPSIPPGGSDTFTVEFGVDADGVFGGDVSITNNDSDENPFNFRIGGTVTPLAPVQTFRDCPECPDMVRIPGQPFAAGRYEVTFAQWDACVAAWGCTLNGYRPSDAGWGRGNRPVISVSWNHAQAYVQWLSRRTGRHYRLLTSDEWEIATRAGTTTNFSWGDQDPVCDPSAPNGANFSDCTDDRTWPAGSFQPNAYGLYDVHGNVWEWVEDCYDPSCSFRVIRGGNWYADPEYLRSAFRSLLDPNSYNSFVGFRVGCSTLQPIPPETTPCSPR